MRFATAASVVFLCACAGEKLVSAPPSGVDLSGHWRLNEADSDDPLRLYQSQLVDPSRATAAGTDGGQGGGRGGRQGGRGGGGPGGFGAAGLGAPTTPEVSVLGDALRWPGKSVEIKQDVGLVTLVSGGLNQICRPSSGDAQQHHRKPSGDGSDPHGRDMPPRDRGSDQPVRCGWEGNTLVIQGGEPDEDHPPFDERYNLSDDRQRLIEVVGFKGGRSAGFTVSRVWDRVVPGAAAPGPGAPVPGPGGPAPEFGAPPPGPRT